MREYILAKIRHTRQIIVAYTDDYLDTMDIVVDNNKLIRYDWAQLDYIQELTEQQAKELTKIYSRGKR